MNRNRPAFTFMQVLVVLAILVVLACMGFLVPIDLGFQLAFGWAFYLARVLPKVRPEPAAIATAAFCLAGFGWGLHRSLAWLHVETRTPEDAAPGRWKGKWTACLVALVVLMFVAGVCTVGIAHQVGWLLSSRLMVVDNSASVAARRAQSMNNLKQMGLGLLNYRNEFRAFPPGSTFDGSGRAIHGWQTALLPLLEEAALYNQINQSVPWDDPRNRAAFATVLEAYRNPGIAHDVPRERGGYALAHYAGNARVLGGRALVEIQDGASVTILGGEVPAGFRPWGDPLNWRDPALGINRSPAGFGGPYPGGANMLFADGTVRFVKDTIDAKVLKALSTPAGGEAVSADSY